MAEGGPPVVPGDEEEEEDKIEMPPPEPKFICYCGKERNFNIVELLCANCNAWFHESCIGFQLGRMVPFLSNYVFLCKICSQTGLEVFKKSQAQFQQMCITTLANLQHNSIKEGQPRRMFSKEKEIIPFIDDHWDALTTSARRVTQSWHVTVQKTLVRDLHISFIFEDSSVDGHMYGLFNNDLKQIKPNYEQMMKVGTLKRTATGVQYVPPVGTGKGRSSKRKVGADGSGSKRGRQVDLAGQRLPAHGYPMDHPYNKDGYRYLLAEPDPHAPFRQEFDESNDWAGKPIPGWLYRVLVPRAVLLALHDRAPQLKISDDRLSVTGNKGYCSVRATHWVNHGCWYWEATIVDLPNGAAVRIGWGQDYANLQAPLGYDKFGYSWRSKKGTRFHQARGKHYSAGYGAGDTVGFLIVLPKTNDTDTVPNTYKDRPLVKFKNHLYYEEKDNVNGYLKNLKIIPGSKIVFFKNGESQGEAFLDLFAGNYYPGVSMHKHGTVMVNFGPDFKYPPSKEEYNWRGVNERVEETIFEYGLADMIYFTENIGKLRLDGFVM